MGAGPAADSMGVLNLYLASGVALAVIGLLGFWRLKARPA